MKEYGIITQNINNIHTDKSKLFNKLTNEGDETDFPVEKLPIIHRFPSLEYREYTPHPSCMGSSWNCLPKSSVGRPEDAITGRTQHTPRPGGQGRTQHTPRPGGQGRTQHKQRPGGQGRTQHTLRPGGQGRTQHIPAARWPGENASTHPGQAARGEPSTHLWPGGNPAHICSQAARREPNTPCSQVTRASDGESPAHTLSQVPGESPTHTAARQPGLASTGRAQHTPTARRPTHTAARRPGLVTGRAQYTCSQATRGEPSTHHCSHATRASDGENPAHACSEVTNTPRSQAARASDRESPTHPQPGGQRRTQHAPAARRPGLPFTGWPQVACAPDVIRRAAAYFHDLLRQPVTPSYHEKNRRRGALQYS